MAAVYKSICTEADSLYLMVVKLTEDEIKLKLQMEKLMSTGYVHIAKARYIMGSTCVTKMQLPTENSNPIQPVATVHRKELDDRLIFSIHRKDASSKSDLCSLNDECEGEWGENGSPINNEIFKNVLKNDPKSFKKSKEAFLVDDNLYSEYNDELLDELSSDSDRSLVSVTDPIRLFGILVPGALKQAQVYFKQVVDLLGKCATVQHELRETLHKYNHMEKVKRLIEEAAVEINMNLSKQVYWTPSEKSSVSCISVHSIKKDDDEDDDNVADDTSKVSMKTIRSVFYDIRDDEAQENEMSLWSHEKLESGSDD